MLAPASDAAHSANGTPATSASSAKALRTRSHCQSMSPPQPFLCAKYATVSIISTVITRPGIRPARNSAPTDTLANMP